LRSEFEYTAHTIFQLIRFVCVADESFRLNERAEKALSDVKSRFSEVQQQLQAISQKFTGDDNGLIAETTKLSREQSRLEPLVAQINDFHKLKSVLVATSQHLLICIMFSMWLSVQPGNIRFEIAGPIERQGDCRNGSRRSGWL
jgi:uncharacterized protein YdhG (YjbR/CyaY superfamily)